MKFSLILHPIFAWLGSSRFVKTYDYRLLSFLFIRNLSFLILNYCVSYRYEFSSTFTKQKDEHMSVSEFIFDPVDLPSAVRYDKLFENLPAIREQRAGTGRPPVSRNSLLKTLIYKALRRIVTLVDLNFELNNNPSVSQALGFNPLRPAPSVERFSSFLHDIKNQELKTVHQQLVQELIIERVITSRNIAIDSCPIVVPLRENNLKTSMANRFDKTRKPTGDTDAGL